MAHKALVDLWAAGRRIWRAHPHPFGSAQLDARAGADARFSTIGRGRTVIPVLYGGENDEAAASETIFHTVDTPGGAHRPRQVFLDEYRSWQWSQVVTTRDLRLIRLDGPGTEALGTTRAELIEGDRRSYPRTRTWAAALAAAPLDVDGLWWRSRQAPARWAVVLFGRLPRRAGGIRTGDLAADGPAVPFSSAGLDRLDQIADELDITVVRS